MKRYVLIIAALLLFLCGCKAPETKTAEFSLYYINKEGNELLKKESSVNSESVEDWISNVTELLNNSEISNGKPLVHDGIEILNVNKNNDTLSVNVSSAYDSFTDTDKLLFRAGITKEYTQNSSIRYVLLTVDGRPIFDSKGNEIGPMKASDFLELSNDNINNYVKENMTLYFLSESKDSLVAEKRTVYHSANILKEQAVVNELIKGSAESGHRSALVPELAVLSVSVLDGICYVNFGDNCNTVLNDNDPKLQIYSIVNSLNKVCGVEKVMFSITGNNQIAYRNEIDLTQPFTPDFTLVEEEK